MEKVRIEEITEEQEIWEFYCDHCGKKLGETKKEPYKCRDTLGDFFSGIKVEGVWYTCSKCFCPKCREEFLDKYIKTIKELGFKKQE